MKRKKNIVDEISLLMMGPDASGNDAVIMERLNNVPDINMKGRDGRTLLIHACTYRRNVLARQLTDKGADLNAQDDMGYSALHACVISGNHDCAAMLIQAGAEINPRDSIGNVPSFYVRKDDYEMLRLLLSHGADYDARNEYGISPIDTNQANAAAMRIFDEYRRKN